MRTKRATGMAMVRRIDARMIDEAECVCSVMLAILVAHRVGVGNVSWAAFSGYMVMRGHVAETLSRGLLRIAGTIAGGLLALAAGPLLVSSRPLAALALAVIGTVSLYGAITARRAYAWLFFGLTFAMIGLDAIEHPGTALAALVRTRMLETSLGTLACVAISLASTLTLRRWWPGVRPAPPAGLGWHRDAARHAAQGGVALAVLVLVAGLRPIPALAQGAVTIMAVMLVPVAGIGPSGLVPVSRRIAHRFVGCAGGAVLAAIALVAAQGSATILILATIAGVAIGRHLENGDHPRRYVGTQFTLAVLTTLVPDSYAHAAVAPALERLSGVLVGMAILEPVLLAWHLVDPSRHRMRAAAAASPGGPGDL